MAKLGCLCYQYGLCTILYFTIQSDCVIALTFCLSSPSPPPQPPIFLHATLKSWEEPGNKTMEISIVYEIALLWYALMYLSHGNYIIM